jgi:hypothetical protein
MSAKTALILSPDSNSLGANSVRDFARLFICLPGVKSQLEATYLFRLAKPLIIRYKIVDA